MTVAPSPSGYHGSGFFGLPASHLARRAVLVALGTLAWLAVLVVLGVLGFPDWGWGAQLAVGASGLIAALAAVASGVAAVVAIARGERSLALAVPLLLGVLWAAMLLGELLLPH